MFISQIYLNRYGAKDPLKGSITVNHDNGTQTSIAFTQEEAVALMASLKTVLKRQAAEMSKRFDEAIESAPSPLLLETKSEVV
jgi:hypothetical protein